MKEMNYDLTGIEMRLKRLTFDEGEKINSILKFSNGRIEITKRNSIKFLSIILEPIDRSVKVKFVKRKFSKIILSGFLWNLKGTRVIYPGDCIDDTLKEITKDFFLRRIEKESELKNYFSTLAGKLKK
jgi:hypothetical protein